MKSAKRSFRQLIDVDDFAENAILIIHFEETTASKNWFKCVTTQRDII